MRLNCKMSWMKFLRAAEIAIARYRDAANDCIAAPRRRIPKLRGRALQQDQSISRNTSVAERDYPRVASATPASVNTSAAICPAPSGSCSATAEATTPMTGTAMVPIAATEAGRRASAANQLT